jgi:predicted metal-dependent HD superfamily phosphohydrolase
MDDSALKAMQERWDRLSERVGAFARVEESEMTFEMVRTMYDHPPRSYHTLEHIARCLSTFDKVRMLAERRDALEFAIWLHDCVFFPERHDNEVRSADAAGMIAGLLGCEPGFVEDVRELVIVTRHDSCPVGGDAALIADVDLAVLGGPAREYDAYRHQIREEFAFADDDLFRTGRIAFLERLLDRPRIYTTAYVRRELEDRARVNLQRELDELTAAP